MMLEFYGRQPPGKLAEIEVGGICPHCKKGTKFVRISEPRVNDIRQNQVLFVVISYGCLLCRGYIPVCWHVAGIEPDQIVVESPELVIPEREIFDFDYVPEKIREEIEEALDCLSVNAYNGFAAVCRRAIQAICTELGANATTRVKKQIDEMLTMSDLDDEWKDLAEQIMLSGHDGSHPHLPEMNHDRAAVLLSLLKDLTYQLFTRRGKVKRASELRQSAIERQSSGLNNENILPSNGKEDQKEFNP